ncbi:hypothetical protein [Soonwooa sp.]|uniref:hypothetical protein n=1 Tax=Soonwooa sp. TaxID=1938592 RepID=UPI00261961A3|nr:hypothetical protein [Soonwooa sp.]
MEILPLEIELNFNRKFFEEIYFKNNNGNIFFGPQTKSFSIAFIILSVFLILIRSNFTFYSANWPLFYFLVFIDILVFLNLAARVFNILKWKNSIRKYLDSIENHSTYKLIADENAFAIILDENITKEKWSEIKATKMQADYISLKGNYEYFIPKKSMTDSEYENLKKIIDEKIGK